jgi:hypothetical protein
MNKLSLVAGGALCATAIVTLLAGGTSRAATPPPTPVVSVTTLPALPSPGAATAHPVTPAPATTLPPLAAPTLPPGQTPAPNATLALPPPGTAIVISGLVGKPQIITLGQLNKLPSGSLTMRIVDADGKHRFHTFSGALLRAAIDFAQPLDAGGTSTSTRAYAVIQGVGGKSAIVAFPEFENDFAGKRVLLATTIDARPAPQGTATLVIEGDATRGRFVEGVTRILIADAGP